MRIRLVKIDEVQFLICIKHEVWGSNRARFRSWKSGEFVAFIVDKRIGGIAEIVGSTFEYWDPIWDNGIFPFRVPIKFFHVSLPENRLAVEDNINNILMAKYGNKYGHVILNQNLLSQEESDSIKELVSKTRNDFLEVSTNIDFYINKYKNITK